MSPQLTADVQFLCELVHGDGDFGMLKGYFDESGIHSGSPMCVVTGFVLPARHCSALSRTWQDDVLFKHRIPFFHAKDFAKRSGPFRGWDDRRCGKFSIDALAAINAAFQTDDTIIGAAINASDFSSLSVDERLWLTGGQFVLSEQSGTRKWRKQGAPSKPYFVVFRQAVLDAVKFTQDKDVGGRYLGTGEMVHFVFDQQREYESSARAIFNVLKRSRLSVRGRIGDVVFTSKLRAIPLQVADFMAYESFCYLCHRELHGEERLSQNAKRLLERRWSQRLVYIDRRELARLLVHSPLTPNKFFLPPDPVDTRVQLGIPGGGF